MFVVKLPKNPTEVHLSLNVKDYKIPGTSTKLWTHFYMLPGICITFERCIPFYAYDIIFQKKVDVQNISTYEIFKELSDNITNLA